MGCIVCVICARSGSKGVPNKNIRPLLGKPLLAYSIETAVESSVFDYIVVTSDSLEYLEIASIFGADMVVHRPPELSADTVTKLGAIEHAVSYVEMEKGKGVDIIVDLDVTSPLRIVEDILGALELFNQEDVASVITGSQSHRSPYTNLVELKLDGCVKLSKPTGKVLSRRQEAPLCYDMNASVYIWNRQIFHSNPNVFYEDTLLYEMPFERSWDIDREIDLEIVEFLLSRRAAV